MNRTTALRVIADRIGARKEGLAQAIVDRFRLDIVGYNLEEGEPEYDQAVAFCLRSIEALLSGLKGDEPISRQFLDEAADLGRYLMRHGVSLDALNHCGRVWGSELWDAVVGSADANRADEREAALWIGSRIWTHVDLVSTTAANGYIDEITDRGLMRRELLDGLLAGRGATEYIQRIARQLHVRLGEDHIVVIIRGEDVPVEEAHERPQATRLALDHIAEAARRHLCPEAGTVLMGIRNGDLVVMYPATGPLSLDAARRDTAVAATEARATVSIGMSGWHPGLPGLASAYAEAREAVEIAAGLGIRGRAVALEDVLVDHIVRCSQHAQRLLEDLLAPLVKYDREHRAELIATLRAYIDCRTNLTRSARQLMVNPNTVVYRLRRIRELTGRDPHDTSQLMVLFLALRLRELSTREAAA